MTVIQQSMVVDAPIERCFLLSLNVDLHKESTAKTSEEIIAGVAHGVMRLNDTVTWRARHFGLRLKHATLISEYAFPTYFQDLMIKGAFKSFVHDHYFTRLNEDATLVRDELRFEAPFRPLGLIAERLVLREYLRRFLEERNGLIKRVAESESSWQQFMQDL